MEIRLYRKTGWWSEEYVGVRTMQKNAGSQLVSWHAPTHGEYRLKLKMAVSTDKWTYDGNAEIFNCSN